MEYKLRGSFVCNKYRFLCEGNCDEEIKKQLSGDIKPGDPDFDPYLYPRKQSITCLGKYCDQPCQYQKAETDLTLDKAIILIKYFGQRLNDLLIKE